MARLYAPNSAYEPTPDRERPLVKIDNEVIRQRAGGEWTGDQRFQ